MSALGKSRIVLIGALEEAFPTLESLRQFTDQRLEIRLDAITTGTLRVAITDLVRHCEDQRRTGELLAAAGAARPENPNLQIQIDACRKVIALTGPQDWYRAPDPLEACILKGCIALFDRNELRAALAQILNEDGHNVLTVSGARGSGCTHTLELVVHLRAELRTFRLAAVDLEDVTTDTDPRSIIIDIAQQIGIADEPPRRQAQTARWSHALLSWLLGKIEDADEPVWIVFDGHEHISPRREIIELINELADRAERKCLHVRVLLLGWSTPLQPPRLESRVLHDNIAPMGNEVLNEFFTRYFEHQDRSPDPESVKLAVEALEAHIEGELMDNLELASNGAVAIARTLANVRQ